LLYPIDIFIHTIIPLIGEKKLKFLHSFLPFFNGISTDLYQYYTKKEKLSSEIFIVNIDKNTISNTNNIKIKDYLSKNCGELPKNIKTNFTDELKLIKKDCNEWKNPNADIKDLNIRMKNLFLYTFVEILFDYEKYMHMINAHPVFNSFSFAKDRKKMKDFIKEYLLLNLLSFLFRIHFLFTKKDILMNIIKNIDY
jgi:hypothetical protein